MIISAPMVLPGTVKSVTNLQQLQSQYCSHVLTAREHLESRDI